MITSLCKNHPLPHTLHSITPVPSPLIHFLEVYKLMSFSCTISLTSDFFAQASYYLPLVPNTPNFTLIIFSSNISFSCAANFIKKHHHFSCYLNFLKVIFFWSINITHFKTLIHQKMLSAINLTEFNYFLLPLSLRKITVQCTTISYFNLYKCYLSYNIAILHQLHN